MGTSFDILLQNLWFGSTSTNHDNTKINSVQTSCDQDNSWLHDYQTDDNIQQAVLFLNNGAHEIMG